MNLLLPFDTETTGMPDWKTPSGGENQPHLVQIAALLVDDDTGKTIQSIDLIIKPDGWVIPEEVSAIHGITNEMAMDVGVPEVDALVAFVALWKASDRRIAFNRTFDQRIIRIATKRYFEEDVVDQWAEKGDFDCAMMMAQKVMGGKRPNLADAYKHFTGKDLIDAHSAMADTQACLEVYRGAREGGAV